jgi:hypothetical protein
MQLTWTGTQRLGYKLLVSSGGAPGPGNLGRRGRFGEGSLLGTAVLGAAGTHCRPRLLSLSLHQVILWSPSWDYGRGVA